MEYLRLLDGAQEHFIGTGASRIDVLMRKQTCALALARKMVHHSAMDDASRSKVSLCVVAQAQWAGLRSKLPVEGRAWFLVGGDLGQSVEKLAQAYAGAASAYPTIVEAIERAESSAGDKCALTLRLRSLEVYDEDISHSGMGAVRLALDKRAQVCGMRVVAAINALRSSPGIHGMPLDRSPADCPGSKIESMSEELALMEALPCAPSGADRRL